MSRRRALPDRRPAKFGALRVVADGAGRSGRHDPRRKKSAGSGFLAEGWEDKARAAGFDAVLPKLIVDGQLLEAVIKRTGVGANACPPATP